MTVPYHRPTSLAAATRALAETPRAIVLAGGTDIYPAHTGRTAWTAPDIAPAIVDLSRVDALRGIEDRGDHWWIGATTTWSDIVAYDLPQLFDGLKAAAREIGGIQIQNRGTLGGNICTASPAGDSIPCLLSLGATVELVSAMAPRHVPLDGFITGYRKTALAAGELVAGVRIPKQAGAGHFLKLGARRYLVISIAMVAGVFDVDAAGVVQRARIAAGACSPVAKRLPALEARMRGAPIGAVLPCAADFDALAPIDDVRASAAYRRAAILQLTTDLIADAAQQRRAA